VWAPLVIFVSFARYGTRGRLLAGFRIMLLMSLFEVGIPQTGRKSVAVIAGGKIRPELRRIAEAELGEFEDALGTQEARDFRSFRPQRQSHVHRDVRIFKENGMHVRRVAAILPAINAAKSRGTFGGFIN